MKTKTKVMHLEEVKNILEEHKEEIKQKYKIKEIGIFGSFTRGEQKKKSDIDILVKFEETPDLLRFIEIERYISRILKKKVDLVRKEAIRKELKERILNEVIFL